jgi:hypothetical protein
MAHRKPGPKPGATKGRPAYNPSGKNQHTSAAGLGARASKVFGARLPVDMDEKVRAIAASEGLTMTQITEEALTLWLSQKGIFPDKTSDTLPTIG